MAYLQHYHLPRGMFTELEVTSMVELDLRVGPGLGLGLGLGLGRGVGLACTVTGTRRDSIVCCEQTRFWQELGIRATGPRLGHTFL